MSTPVNIFGAGARGSQGVAVTEDQELLVTVSPNPPFDEQRIRPLAQYLTTDGTASGSNDMGVDGSVTSSVFYIGASETDDRYISQLEFIIGYGTSAQPYQFADSTALTNGVRIYYESRFGETEIFNAKSNQDFFRLNHIPTTTNWEVRGVNALNDYGYFISFDLKSFIQPYGIKLDRSLDKKLAVEIRDNCTNADSFNCYAFGFERFET